MPLAPGRIFALATASGAVVGVVVAVVVMTIAWQHNPQGEFHEAGTIRRAWFTLGLLYTSVGMGIGALIGALLAFRARGSRGRSR